MVGLVGGKTTPNNSGLLFILYFTTNFILNAQILAKIVLWGGFSGKGLEWLDPITLLSILNLQSKFHPKLTKICEVSILRWVRGLEGRVSGELGSKK